MIHTNINKALEEYVKRLPRKGLQNMRVPASGKVIWKNCMKFENDFSRYVRMDRFF